MANIEEKVEELIKPEIEKLGYKLYDVEYVKEGKDYYLRIYIDSKKGIDLSDCEKTSSSINDILDKADYIKSEYFLEVSSPGIERILRKDDHLNDNLGKEVEIKLFKPINNTKAISGILIKYDKEKIYLKINEEEQELERKLISQIKLKYNW